MAKEDESTAIRVFNPRYTGDKKMQAALLVIKGPMTGRTIYLESKPLWKVGRSTEADIVFQDDSISRFHFSASFQDNKWTLEDLNSVNGTWVNGERIQSLTLVGNEKIQIGSSLVLKFVLQDEIEAAFQRELYDSATKDSLTGLDSKRYFLERLEMDFLHHGRTGHPLSIVILDIDHFKKVNDTLGHLAGDSILKQLGELLLKILRKGDALGRYGGEELVFSLRDTPLKGAKIFAERLRKLIEEHTFAYDEKRIPIRASFGVAVFVNGNFSSSAEFLKMADHYLYQAKKAGRNRVASADSDLPPVEFPDRVQTRRVKMKSTKPKKK